MTSPACTTASPARASSPASRTLLRSFTGASNATRLPGRPSPSTLRTISYFTTESAAAGSGAPVMMRTHAPSGISPSNVSPAATSAITSSSTGVSGLAPSSCAARTANPSIAEWANGEISISLCRSVAATRPAASKTGTVSAGSCETCDKTRSRACSTEIISGMTFLSKAFNSPPRIIPLAEYNGAQSIPSVEKCGTYFPASMRQAIGRLPCCL